VKTARQLRGLIVAAITLASTPNVRSQDWPQWRGANRDAKAAGFIAPTTWPKELTQKWKVAVGGGDSSPALVGDRLYVFTRQAGDEVIRCLDASSGKAIWEDKYEVQPATSPAGGPHAGPRSSPTVADGKVVTLGVRGTLSCFDASTGKKLWRRDEFRAWPQFFTASSPIVVSGICIAQLGGRDNGALVAYDLSTGTEKWKCICGCPGYASPVLMDAGGTQLIVALTDSKIIAARVGDGKLVWEAPFPTKRMAYNASTPIVDGQILIYGGSGRGETAVKLDKGVDGVASKELWTNPENSVQFNSPVLKNGLVIGLTQNNQFFAIDEQTGKTVWSAPAASAAPAGSRERGGRGSRGGYGSIVDANTVLLALTPASDLIVLQPDDKKLNEVSRIKVAASPTYAYPVVSGNRLFVKDQDSLTLWTVE
jgi:outer membrane protein assembly factor BamB